MASATQSNFHILICMIKIWDPQNTNNAEPEQALYLTEVENIEIEDSYKQLIGTASVKFPRGTVVRKTVTGENESEIADSPSLTASVEDTGAVIVTRNYTRKAEVSDFKIGNRIKIWLGYTTDPAVSDSFKITSKNSIYKDVSKRNSFIGNTDQKCLSLMFDGYIVKCSMDHPIEIRCENLASKLKKISCPDITLQNATVNDLFSTDGKCKFLKNTGLELHPKTKSCEINIGTIELNTHLTIADVLSTWRKAGLMSFVKEYDGKPCLAIGRTYFSNADKDSIIKHQDGSTIPKILFDYHVAKNDLTLTGAELLFLAVEATALDKQGKFYHVTIRLNPDWDGNSSKDKYQLLNEVKITKKAQQMGATVMSKSQGNKRVDLSTYTILPYMSSKIGIDHEDLVKEAIKYFESCNKNGIDGTLTLFGDLSLKSGCAVELEDNRYPHKNGYYFVEEVYTTFGVGGYRQRIKLPYRISSSQINETGGVKQ